jgi:SAM-dependent methyltransferase
MDIEKQTIHDFGKQWTRYQDIGGYFGSMQLFSDIISPFFEPEALVGCRVGEIGSGSGRIVNMLLRAGASHVIAVEPSEEAFNVLVRNMDQPEKVTCLQITGDQLPSCGDLDYIFSIGVLHHIPDPAGVVKAAFNALRPGGKFIVWLYGKEGNRFLLFFLYPLRALTKRLPHYVLAFLVWSLYFPLVIYMKLCQRLSLPLREYLLTVFEKMSADKRRLIIYDQLNPAYSKYYTRFEAEKLLCEAKFEDIQIHHRHGYSWTIIGTKP